MATSEVNEWSDIDLAIIKDTELNYFDRLFEFKKILRSKLATDVFIYQPQEFAVQLAENHYFVVDEIMNKGKLLYDSRRAMA